MLPQPPLWLDPDRVRLRARAARLLPRARPLSRRAGCSAFRPRPSRSASAARCRLDRPAGHALEGRLAAARRLREVRRRHEPGEQSRRSRQHLPSTARPCIPDPAGLAAVPRRARRPGRQFPARDPDLRRLLRACRRRRTTERRRRGRAERAAAAAGIAAGRPDRCRSPGAPTPTFDDIRSVVAVRPGRNGCASRSSAAAQSRVRRHAWRRDSISDGYGDKIRARRAWHPLEHCRSCEPVPIYRGGADGRRLHASADPRDRRRRWSRSSRARSRPRSSAARSRSRRSPGRGAELGLLPFVSCLRCFQLISDSSTSCQSRCWMEGICSSTPSRPSGGARSAPGRWNGRSAAGLPSSSRWLSSRRSTIWARLAFGTGFSA